MNGSKTEISEHFLKLYKEYRFSKERKENLEKARKVTAEDLARRFTV